MAVTNDALLWAVIIIMNTMLFLWPNDYVKRMFGWIMMILIGVAGYVFLATTVPWGVLIAIFGVVGLVQHILST